MSAAAITFLGQMSIILGFQKMSARLGITIGRAKFKFKVLVGWFFIGHGAVSLVGQGAVRAVR